MTMLTDKPLEKTMEAKHTPASGDAGHAAQARGAMRNRVLTLAFVVVLALMPVLPTPEFWITLGNYIGLYSIVAIGLVLLTGVGGMTSFGQAAFVGLGAYSTAYLTTQFGLSPWFGLIVGLVITMASAYVIGLITMRMSGHYLPLATIAWGLSLFYLFGNLEFLGKYDGLNGIPVLSLFGIELQSGRSMFYLIWAVVLLAVLAVQNLLNSRPGRAIRALKGGGTMAEAMGVNTAWMKVVIFVVAAMLACVSGFLYAHLQRAVNPTPFGLNYGIEYLFMAVVGGVGHVWAMCGAPCWARAFSPSSRTCCRACCRSCWAAPAISRSSCLACCWCCCCSTRVMACGRSCAVCFRRARLWLHLTRRPRCLCG